MLRELREAFREFRGVDLHGYDLFAGYSSVQQYIKKSRMSENATWDSDIEIIT